MFPYRNAPTYPRRDTHKRPAPTSRDDGFWGPGAPRSTPELQFYFISFLIPLVMIITIIHRTLLIIIQPHSTNTPPLIDGIMIFINNKYILIHFKVFEKSLTWTSELEDLITLQIVTTTSSPSLLQQQTVKVDDLNLC